MAALIRTLDTSLLSEDVLMAIVLDFQGVPLEAEARPKYSDGEYVVIELKPEVTIALDAFVAEQLCEALASALARLDVRRTRKAAYYAWLERERELQRTGLD